MEEGKGVLRRLEPLRVPPRLGLGAGGTLYITQRTPFLEARRGQQELVSNPGVLQRSQQGGLVSEQSGRTVEK